MFAADLNERDKAFIATVPPLISLNSQVNAIAFTHAEVIDGTGGAAKSEQTLVIDKGRIVPRIATR